MKITIRIECETIGEFGSHLLELFKQLKKEVRKQKLNPHTDVFKRKDSDALCDSNCYGTHEVVITNERV